MIKSFNGKVAGSVSKKTSYLIACGEYIEERGFNQIKKLVTETSKYLAATKNGTKILTDVEFEEMIF